MNGSGRRCAACGESLDGDRLICDPCRAAIALIRAAAATGPNLAGRRAADNPRADVPQAVSVSPWERRASPRRWLPVVTSGVVLGLAALVVTTMRPRADPAEHTAATPLATTTTHADAVRSTLPTVPVSTATPEAPVMGALSPGAAAAAAPSGADVTTAIPTVSPEPTATQASVPVVSVPPDPGAQAVSTVEALTRAWAAGDWPNARRLQPQAVDWSDEAFDAAYAGIEEVAVVPVEVTPTEGGHIQVRFGYAEFGYHGGRPSTTLYCADWTTDPSAGTVVDSSRTARVGEISGWTARDQLDTDVHWYC